MFEAAFSQIACLQGQTFASRLFQCRTRIVPVNCLVSPLGARVDVGGSLACCPVRQPIHHISFRCGSSDTPRGLTCGPSRLGALPSNQWRRSVVLRMRDKFSAVYSGNLGSQDPRNVGRRLTHFAKNSKLATEPRAGDTLVIFNLPARATLLNVPKTARYLCRQKERSKRSPHRMVG
jgi:hypothetical protein